MTRPARGTRVLKTLDRILSKAGAGSRTEARRWIADGRVRVGGRQVRDPETWLDPGRVKIELDGAPLTHSRRHTLLVYKPKGYLTTYRDPQGRKTVYDLLPPGSRYLFPVGRLDLDTSGLLLMTNDSRLAERLTNPDHEVPKTYLVKASKLLTDQQLATLAAGVTLGDGPTRPARVTRVRDSGGRTVFEITLTEGRNRQVRRMVESQDAKVLKLVRIAIGPIRIAELTIGGVRDLRAEELRLLAGPSGRSGRQRS